MENIREIIGNRFLIFDGAMGTMVQKSGLPIGKAPETFNLLKPEIIQNIHKEYIKAGADVITTNTFGANEIKLEHAGFSVEEVVSTGVNIAKSVANQENNKYVALSVGPIGQLLEPMGTLKFEKAYDIFKRQILCGVNAGCDIILILTMSDIYEAKAAILAAKENCNLPVFCTMTFNKDERTFTGTDPLTMVSVLEGLGVDALGVNCSLGPKALLPIVEKIAKYSSIPIMVQPNAGLPRVINGKTVYELSPEDFADYQKKMADLGATILGGCCGTGYEHIKALKEKLCGMKPKMNTVKNYAFVSSPSNTVILNDNITIIGERINPSGKKKMKEALKTGNMEYILKEAIFQKEAGADILDVNVGIPDIDESKVMKKVIKDIQSVIDIPLQIDASQCRVIEEAVRIYNGKPIINSVNGKVEVMKKIFPIAKRYGACIIGLTIDENGIPNLAEDRVKIAERIINYAANYGIPKKNIIIDCLTLTASAQQQEVFETLKALKMVKEKFGVMTTLGISNISFGLPRRDIINRTFLAMALEAGLDAPIVDPTTESIIDTINGFKVLNSMDIKSKKYISFYSANVKTQSSDIRKIDLKEAIIKGLSNEAVIAAKSLIQNCDPMRIANEYIIPALDVVGEKFEKDEIFLPQLVQSAEIAKSISEIIKENMNNCKASISKGKIILATVKGDVHDIGKNIVKMLLQSHGYEVIDLGKDVDAETIIKCAREENIKLVGLSALMTTTLKSMESTINGLRKNNISCKVMVGGAVLNKEYADMIGADYYAEDANESVEIAKKVLG